MLKNIDHEECIRKGMIGAIGSIPSTIAAHPFDVMKIRMQISGCSIAEAISHINGKDQSYRALKNYYRGLSPGIQQKVFTRGPMFFFSSLSSQTVECMFGLEKVLATFYGSFLSGYSTGFIASINEWRKVLQSTTVGPLKKESPLAIALRCGNSSSVAKRMHGAGTRNGIFDSVFFGTQHYFEHKHSKNISAGYSYGLAAMVAVILDYVVDAAVKRNMSIHPKIRVNDVFYESWSIVKERGFFGAYRGLSVKSMEFAISYFITGTISVYVTNILQKLILDKK